MTPNRLNDQVDKWTVQAVMAGQHLLRLYRSLGDDKQAATALRTLASSEERARRLRLDPMIVSLRNLFLADHPIEVDAEEAAWRLLLEAQAGLCAFHAVAIGTQGEGKLRGSSTATTKALHAAIKGFRTAFPESMVQEGVRGALHGAARRCAETCVKDVEDLEGEERERVTQSIQDDLLEALSAQVRL
jgi:hypothetical protein